MMGNLSLFCIPLSFWQTRSHWCFICFHFPIFWDIDFDIEGSFELLEFFIASLHLEFEGFDFFSTEKIDIEIERLKFSKENVE